MLGLGIKAKAKKIIEDDLGYFVTPMYTNRFNHIVRVGKSSGHNEYSMAISFVLYCKENLYETWSDESGKVTDKEIIDNIQARSKDIERIVHLANISQTEFKERLNELVSKCDQSLK